jgi:hypothetical protein
MFIKQNYLKFIFQSFLDLIRLEPNCLVDSIFPTLPEV